MPLLQDEISVKTTPNTNMAEEYPIYSFPSSKKPNIQQVGARILDTIMSLLKLK